MFCICGSHEADQCLCFRYIDSTIPLLCISENLSLGFLIRSDTNRDAQPQKMVRGLKFQMIVHVLTKALRLAVQLLHSSSVPWLLHMQNTGFLMT